MHSELPAERSREDVCVSDAVCVFSVLPQGSPGKMLRMLYTEQQDCRGGTHGQSSIM